MVSEIATERLRLMPVTPADEDALCALFWHPQVGRYLSEQVPTGGAIRQIIDATTDPSSIASFWRVATRDGTGLLGLVGVWRPSTSALALRPIGWRSLELVVAFHPDAWGKGLATEAVEPVIEHGLADGVTFAILGAVAEPNRPAHALMRRCRFAELGRVTGSAYPIVVYERAF
ncbi:MAG: GNAT family N-acetyltransferase [Hyphomicrobiaceae bacterium]|jgi:RimJ/RimL family protein N-acetyltransferase